MVPQRYYCTKLNFGVLKVLLSTMSQLHNRYIESSMRFLPSNLMELPVKCAKGMCDGDDLISWEHDLESKGFSISSKT